MQEYFVRKGDITKLLEFLPERFETFVINRKGEDLYWKKFDPEQKDKTVISEHRPAEPLKPFIFKSREKILDEFKDFQSKEKPFAIIGAKACDLHALKISDYVFLEGDHKDPFYAKMREENLIISADCTAFKDVCFCLAVGLQPFPRENYDLNVSELREGYIITVGSAKGKKVLEASGLDVTDITEDQKNRLEQNRDNFLKKLKPSIDFMKLPEKDSLKEGIRASFKSELWDNFAATCVECGGCNMICPTCHCFLLVDQSLDDKYQRLKVWDSCLMKTFARVAGGANPRKHLSARLRNRFVKKYDFFPEVLGEYACTGCGRCIETCPGDIDLREVLKESCKVKAGK